MSLPDIDIIGFVQGWASTTADKTTLWLALGILFLLLYFALIWFIDIGKSIAIVLAYIPILVLDSMVSFGKYTFTLPFIPFNFTYSMEKGVATLNLIDWIFNFGIWKSWGLATFNSVNGAVVLDQFQTAFVYIFALGDSLLEFIIITYILYSILDDFKNATAISLILVAAYTIWANPLKELATTKATVEHIAYFFGHASDIQIIIVLASAFISFALVVFLISTVTNLIVGVGKSTIRPGLEASSWEYSFTGLAFGMGLAYSIVQLLHPNFTWYVFFILMIPYSIFRSSMNGYAEERRADRRQKDTIREVVEEYRR